MFLRPMIYPMPLELNDYMSLNGLLFGLFCWARLMFQREFTDWLDEMIEPLCMLKFFLFKLGPMPLMPDRDIRKFFLYTFSTLLVFLFSRRLLFDLFRVCLKLLAFPGEAFTSWALF